MTAPAGKSKAALMMGEASNFIQHRLMLGYRLEYTMLDYLTEKCETFGHRNFALNNPICIPLFPPLYGSFHHVTAAPPIEELPPQRRSASIPSLAGLVDRLTDLPTMAFSLLLLPNLPISEYLHPMSKLWRYDCFNAKEPLLLNEETWADCEEMPSFLADAMRKKQLNCLIRMHSSVVRATGKIVREFTISDRSTGTEGIYIFPRDLADIFSAAGSATLSSITSSDQRRVSSAAKSAWPACPHALSHKLSPGTNMRLQHNDIIVLVFDPNLAVPELAYRFVSHVELMAAADSMHRYRSLKRNRRLNQQQVQSFPATNINLVSLSPATDGVELLNAAPTDMRTKASCSAPESQEPSPKKSNHLTALIAPETEKLISALTAPTAEAKLEEVMFSAPPISPAASSPVLNSLSSLETEASLSIVAPSEATQDGSSLSAAELCEARLASQGFTRHIHQGT